MNSSSYEYLKYVSKGGTVCAQGNADYMLENLPREENMHHYWLVKT